MHVEKRAGSGQVKSELTSGSLCLTNFHELGNLAGIEPELRAHCSVSKIFLIDNFRLCIGLAPLVAWLRNQEGCHDYPRAIFCGQF